MKEIRRRNMLYTEKEYYKKKHVSLFIKYIIWMKEQKIANEISFNRAENFQYNPTARYLKHVQNVFF